ncbi:DUF5680 domain-containing protein [Enterovibrio sp. ZSDZ35]|uniref:DUF5680 domain-containing protein n=1 Tax=Enterovibrio qingdaonensis TaxID=2899818 RepID=A0ABT5QFU9_9GAMM|nr:DUF5680 domain-containing protein [Enterovibrio sp. ZSDZ35]MDD1779861.1 DUF5680 domain-containing protein [Enterovibrio sp. ZSDZ35]
MKHFSTEELYAFIVKAKANSYVARAPKCLPSRQGAHDIQFQNGDFQYLDSYFGGTDFLGQEIVYFNSQPVWAMNYYGRIIEPSLFDVEKAGIVVLDSLAKLYETGHFLGDSVNETPLGTYYDTNSGTVKSFTGYEWIKYDGKKVYELHYHGGLIKA